MGSVTWTTDFPPKFLAFCARHQILPSEAVDLLTEALAEPESGVPVLGMLSDARVIPIATPDNKIEFVSYMYSKGSGVVLVMDITEFDIHQEKLRLVMDPVAAIRLIRAGARIIEWLERLFS